MSRTFTENMQTWIETIELESKRKLCNATI